MPTARKVADYLIERPWLGTTAVVTALLWLMAARNPMLSLSPQGGTAPPFPYLFAKQEGTTLTLLGRRADGFTLTNQAGRWVSLRDFRGRVVLMTFFCTRCPGADSNLKLQAVRGFLDRSRRSNLALLSITTEPEVDRPERLLDYAEKHGFDLPAWTFLTGTPEEVQRVLSPYRLYYVSIIEAAPGQGTSQVEEGLRFESHGLGVLIDQEGLIRKLYTDLPALPVDQIARDVERVLTGS